MAGKTVELRHSPSDLAVPTSERLDAIEAQIEKLERLNAIEARIETLEDILESAQGDEP